MDTLDNLLERQLKLLESGMSLETVIDGIPLNSIESEVIPLIFMAEAARNTPKLEMDEDKVIKQKQEFYAALALMTRNSKRISFISFLRESFKIRLFTSYIILVIVVTGLFLYGPINSRSAKLHTISGNVELSSTNESHGKPVVEGQRLYSGQTIRTGKDTKITLDFYNGSSVEIGSGSQVHINQIRGGWSKLLWVEMDQYSGQSHHSVVPFQGQNSYYSVTTPDGNVYVIGTEFSLDIVPGESTLFSVDRGKVWVQNGDNRILLNAGQATLGKNGATPTLALFQFTIQGELEEIGVDHWKVAGVKIVLPSDIDIPALITQGDSIVVKGRLLPGGALFVDRIRESNSEISDMKFDGILETINGVRWTINGFDILVPENIEIPANLKILDTVRMRLNTASGKSWIARSVEILESKSEETSSDNLKTTSTISILNTTTTTPRNFPRLIPGFAPTSTETVLTTDYSNIPGDTNDACKVDSKKHPEGIKLAEEYSVGYSEIIGWFCGGYGFGEIDLVYELSHSSGKPVKEIFDFRATGKGWGTIKEIYGIKIKPTQKIKEDFGKPTLKPDEPKDKDKDKDKEE